VVATDFARDRLARAIFDVVADGLDLGPIAVRTAEDRAWVQAAIAEPIQHAADHALERLVLALIDALDAGRPDLVSRLLAAADQGELEEELPAGRREPSADGSASRDRPLVPVFAPAIGPAAVSLDARLDLPREPAVATTNDERRTTPVAVLR
jgi:hypothetical protein